ncbi:MAG: FdtA/QdtA family cupin domain-containing protein [Lachnospiraceae bacterium]|nr:FdtA/QdtA family cupin domain-containing protein [Lachnospiraceae bacterium]
MGLDSIYWCVSRENERAVRFYDKHNFHEIVDVPSFVLDRYKGVEDLKWYSVLKGDEINVRDTVAGCKVIHIKTIPTINAGELSFFEATREIPFEIKRIYYISKVPEGVRRGFHAHKKLKQILFCPYGRIQLILESKDVREEIELSDPSIAVLIEEGTWREMLWLQKDSVLCVAASEFYDADDYIRDYGEFKKYCGSL